MAEEDLVRLVEEAFVYGDALVADLSEVVRFTQSGMGSVPSAPFNEFSHARTLAGPKDTFVTINNDTLYSIAQLDLSGGPLFLEVPDAHGRYYVLQFIDAWTNNFAYVGKRASGTNASTWFLTPPDWAGHEPTATTQIPVPTMVASILGRWACAGVDDLDSVHALQDQLLIRPADGNAALAGVPTPDPSVPEDLTFFEQMRTWMRAFPPAAPDQAYQQRFAALGLLDDASPWTNVGSDDAEQLAAALDAARAKLEALTHAGTVEKVDGWMIGPHAFDYNIDYFGPGTLNEPQWKKMDRVRGYAERAVAARAGLWGNHGYEAAYALTFDDADGDQLNGAHRYRMTFRELPPVAEFWSITMYDTPNYYLIANPIDRYSIGDRTPGIVYGADGSLTIAIQHDAPADPTGYANWLPAPRGDFRPVLRMYGPKQPVFDGSYHLPPITRVDT